MMICVTNRTLCREDFLTRVRQLAQAQPYAVLLREKDLDVPAYESLAVKVQEICGQYGVELIIHRNVTVAEKLGLTHLQLSMPDLRTYHREQHSLVVGASVHSVAEAKEAQALGAAYVIAGHIFATDCKKGIAPRGVSFLRQVCQATCLPVFAIGGINSGNVGQVLASGARGFCIMSAAMTCKSAAALVKKLAATQK
ncbi:thiamine phosphate synthase [Sporomusa acidovorans]|uniref:Thiamine-phosphate synthase n=1 Tax=Sporomusa acidovorans (strain ATCC 49682 / DSM 3132 / Mol) TaxID=1123286 RepID=A0ABZ3J831_SPOA4|nr:thiamine phosphate synthase [Sporomusa acidovorans]OZC24117.1 regulatory protein TenI [Sporomusa acidovorans DSM 3132]SDF71895.1 thiamine-phosphate pyrophosphorylase [Sporomusa acidovorans]